jgi:hypothetical protein
MKKKNDTCISSIAKPLIKLYSINALNINANRKVEAKQNSSRCKLEASYSPANITETFRNDIHQ